MNQEKYIGMDVHQATISVAVMEGRGKLIMECILETKAGTILEFIQGLHGSLSVTFEEGTSAAWLHDLLKPDVHHLVVCDPGKNARLKDGAYSGFALETHDSGEYRMVRGKVRRNRERLTVLGLNDNHNHDLKNLFKGAAISASTRPGPLYDFYVGLLQKGMRPTMARLTLARKIATITLTLWKKGVAFDAQQLNRPAA